MAVQIESDISVVKKNDLSTLGRVLAVYRLECLIGDLFTMGEVFNRLNEVGGTDVPGMFDRAGIKTVGFYIKISGEVIGDHDRTDMSFDLFREKRAGTDPQERSHTIPFRSEIHDVTLVIDLKNAIPAISSLICFQHACLTILQIIEIVRNNSLHFEKNPVQ